MALRNLGPDQDGAGDIDVAPALGTHMETLAIYFPVVLRDDAVMRVHWGQTMLPFKVNAPYRPVVTRDTR